MRRYALLGEEGTLLGGEGGGKNRISVILSPLETHTYLTELPPLREDKIAGALRFKLRALYPGNPDSTRIDFHPNADAKNHYVAFVTEKTVRERYATSSLPVVAPISILSALAGGKGEKSIAILWTNFWIEAALFEGSKALGIEAVALSSSLEETLARLLENFPGGLPIDSLPVRNAYSPEYSPAPAQIEAALSAKGATLIAFENLSTSRKKERQYHELFIDTRTTSSLYPRIIAGLVVANVLFAAWSLHSIADRREQESQQIKRGYENQKRRYAAVEKNVKELEELEKRYAELAAKKPIDTYQVLADMASCVGNGAWIKSVVLRKDSFTIEAEGTDALQAFTRFEESSAFANIKLYQATPSTKRGEIFSLSGTIRDDK